MVATGRPSLEAAVGVASLLGLLAAGCGEALPGTLLGTYQVTATAQSNACGLAAPGVYQFDVQISRTATMLYWSWLDHTPIASGPLGPVSTSDPTLQASLTASQSSNVDPADGGAGPCTMDRADALSVTLGAGSPPGSFKGTMSYAFSAESGADCTDQLAAAGGSYATLPCTVTYGIAAQRR